MNTPNRLLLPLGLLALIGGLGISSASAASVTWTGAVNGNWDTATGNWTGGAPTANLYANGDDATFDNSAGGTITLAGAIAPSSTTVSAASGTYTFAGTPLTSGSLAKSGGGTLILSAPNSYAGGTTVNGGVLQAGAPANLPGAVSVGAAGTLRLVTTGSQTWGNAITGTGLVQLQFEAAGDTNSTLSGISGFSGTVELTSTGASQNKWVTQALSAPNTTVKINNGAQLFAANGAATFKEIQVSGTGNTENRGAIRVTNTLGGNISLLGNTTIGTEGGSVTGKITSGAAGTQVLTLGTTASNAGTTTFTGTIGGGTGTIALQFLNANTNTTIIPGNMGNTYSGGTTLLHGTNQGTRLVIGSITGTPYGSGAITIGQVATDKAGIFFTTSNTTLANNLVFNTALGTDRLGIRADAPNITLSGKVTANLADATFSTNGTGSLNLTGQVTGPRGLTLDNTHGSSITVNLNNTTAGANNYQGDTNIVGTKGTLRLLAPNQIPNGAGAGNLVNHGAFQMNGHSETINGLSGSGTIDGVSGTPTLTLGDNNASSGFTGVIKNTAGSLAVTKTGTGTVMLSGANTYSGATTIEQGTLLLGAPSSPLAGATWHLDASNAANVNGGAAGAGDFVTSWTANVGPNVSQGTAGNQPTFQTNVQNGLSVIRFDGTGDSLASTTAYADAATVFIVNAFDGSQKGNAGIIGGNGDAGTFGDKGIRISGGFNWRAPGDGNDFTTPAGSEFRVDGVLTAAQSATGFHIISATRNAAAMRFNALGSYFSGREFKGDIGEVLVYGAALSAADRAMVEAYLNYKWFNLGGAVSDVLPTTTALSISGGATLDLNGINQTIGSLAGASGSSVLLGGGTLTVGDATSTTFAGAISEAGHLVKQNAGSLVLAGNNSYSGTTAVQGGALLVNGAHTGGGAYSVASGATLGGTGAINTDNAGVTFAAGGFLSPGASIGTLSMSLGAGTLDISGLDAGSLLFELGAIGNSDQVVLNSGTLDIGTLNFADFVFTTLAGFGAGTYTLFDANSPILGSLGITTGLLSGNRGTLSIDSVNHDVLLTVQTPEPSSLIVWSLLGLSTTLVGRRLRRRRNA